MEKDKRPYLNKQNDRFKICLNLKQFFRKVEKDLEAEVQAKIDAKVASGEFDPTNPETPIRVSARINRGTKNIYIEGLNSGGNGAPTAVVHVSLHLKEGDNQERVGALHGRSNLNDRQFLRYFFEYFHGNPRLRTTTSNTEWRMAQVNPRNYNSLPAGPQRTFVEIVFEILNTYIPAYVLSEEECKAKIARRRGETVEENKSGEEAEGVSSAAEKKSEDEERPSRSGAGAGNEGSAAAASASSSSAAAVSVPRLPRLLPPERKLVDAINNLIEYHVYSHSNGYQLPWIILDIRKFLDVNFTEDVYPNYIKYCDQFIEKGRQSINKCEEYEQIVRRVFNSESLSNLKAKAEKLKRIEFGEQMFKDEVQYYEEIKKRLTEINIAIEELHQESNLLEFNYLEPYLSTEILDEIVEEEHPITAEDMQNYIQLIDTEEKRQEVIRALPFWNFAHVVQQLRIYQVAVDMDNILYGNLTIAILNALKSNKEDKEKIEHLLREIAVTEEKIAGLQTKKETIQQRITELNKQIEEKKGAEKKNAKAKKADYETNIMAIDLDIQFRQLMKDQLEPQFRATKAKLEKDEENIKQIINTRNQIKEAIKKNSAFLIELWRLKDRKYPGRNIPGDLFTEPFLKGGRRKTRRNYKTVRKTKRRKIKTQRR